MPSDEEEFQYDEEVDLPQADQDEKPPEGVREEDDPPDYDEEAEEDDEGGSRPAGFDYPIALDEVASLVEDLENSGWTEWGLWGDLPEGQQPTRLRIRAADFDKPDSSYLTEHQPPETTAVKLQRALSRFLGRD